MVRLAGFVLALVLVSGVPALAADEATILLAQADPGTRSRAATLQLHSRPLFQFRGDLVGYTPEDRAEASARRIEQHLRDGGPGNISVKEVAEGNQILIDGAHVFLITPADVNVLENETLASLTDETVNKLQIAISEARELRDFETVMWSVIFVVLATLIYALIIHFLVRYTSKLRSWLAEKLGSRVEKLKIAGMPTIDPASFRRFMEATVTVLLWVLTLVATYSWATFGMLQFPYTRGWGEQLMNFLLGTAGNVLFSMLGAIPDLMTVLVIVLVARFISGLSHMFFDRVERGWVYVRWMDRDIARPTRRLTTVVIWLFALAMAYPYLPGADTNAFRGLSVIVGLMISIGASSVVGQAASGLVLMYSRAFRAGEYVQIGDKEGTVKELGMFATRVMTPSGEELVLPNSFVLSQSTRNHSRLANGGYSIDTTVTIGYDTPWRQVQAMLKEAAARTEGIRKQPAPYVVQTALSDFYVEYRLVARADADQPRPTVLSELHANILDTFNEHNVQIMSPHYLADPGRPKIVPQTAWYAPPAVMPDNPEKSAA